MPEADEQELIARLRTGENAAFAELVDRHHASMVRLARAFVPSHAVAEEVVQDAWLGVVRGIGRFEGRSSLKTWIFRILVNRAKTAGIKEPRNVGLDDETGFEGRFGEGGGWSEPPVPWVEDVDDRLSAPQVAAKVRVAVENLPASQRQVVTLRDIEGLSSTEVCNMLDISEGNQRVLLHRGRAKVRNLLEAEFASSRKDGDK